MRTWQSASAGTPEGPQSVTARLTLEPDNLFRPRPRRARRFIRRTLAVAAALALMSAIALGGLMLVTPSAGNAERLAMAADEAHHVAFPGFPVPYRFSASLVATEDHRFYSEPGIDPFAIGRVIAARLTGGPDQGGSTLYQQLAKQLYTPDSASVTAKAEQMALAVKLNFTYSKAQILQMYADVAYFGHGFYGLGAASCGYFGEQPAALSWAQAATLAGIVQAPSADDPLVHPATARARQLHVLDRLVATRKITLTQASAALSEPLIQLSANVGGGCSAPRQARGASR